MKRIASPLLILCAVLITTFPVSTAGQRDPAEKLRYMTEEYWPMNYSRDGKLEGFAVETLRLVWREMGVAEQPILLLPWPRAYSMSKTDPRTVIFSMYRTSGRERVYKWVGPIAKGRAEVFALRSKHLSARSLNDFRGRRLAAVREVASANILQEAGLRYTASSNPGPAIAMLDRNRVDAVAMDAFQFRLFSKKLGFSSKEFEPVMTLSTAPLYYAFSRDVPDALVNRFQKALDAVAGRPAYRRLADRYLK